MNTVMKQQLKSVYISVLLCSGLIGHLVVHPSQNPSVESSILTQSNDFRFYGCRRFGIMVVCCLKMISYRWILAMGGSPGQERRSIERPSTRPFSILGVRITERLASYT